MTRPMAHVAPWIGVGTSGSWDNVDEALYDSGLNYMVEQVDAWDDKGNHIPGILANRREDTGEILGVTSDQYGVVNNDRAFSLLDPFCKSGGVIEHAGMTVTGMCFMVMRVPSAAFSFIDGDGFELYVCAMNSFNTKFPLALIITPIRIVCQNMFRKLMKRGDTALLIKHGRFAEDRILSASAASSLLLDYRSDFEDMLMVDYTNPRDASEVDEFVERMLPLVPVTPERPRAKFTNERIMAQREEFIQDYYYAPDNEKYEGTKLGILNAYYDWITHHVPTRASSNFVDMRLGRLLNGESAKRKLIESA